MKYKYTFNLDETLIDEIIKDYEKNSISEIMKKYNLERYKVVKLTIGNGIKKRKDYWSIEELELARNNIIPEGRTRKATDNVRTKRCIGITKSGKRKWNESEITFLKENWNKLTDKEIGNKINRFPGSVKIKRLALGLIENRNWSDVEIDILSGCQNIQECIDRLPNRTEYAIKHMIKNIGIKFNYNRFTLPHQKVCKCLRILGITYLIEKKIDKYFIDCYIPALKLCIEINGEYWHSLTEVKEKDKLKKEYLTSCGYVVLIIKENECKDENIILNILKENIVNCWNTLIDNAKGNQQPS